MRIRPLLIGAALVITTAAITTQVVSQDSGDKSHPASPDDQQMPPEWAAYMTPGDAHKLLEAKVGKWNGAVKHWMDPSQPPGTSTCTSECKSIMGGRYFTDEVKGEFGGTPFLGQALVGYDNLNKQYFFIWIDNMGTGLMSGEGKYDAAAKTFTYVTEWPDPMAGKNVKGRSVDRWIDKDHWVSEMYGPGPDGKEFKTLEITYTRAN